LQGRHLRRHPADNGYDRHWRRRPGSQKTERTPGLIIRPATDLTAKE
jgi:hypothetical protein